MKTEFTEKEVAEAKEIVTSAMVVVIDIAKALAPAIAQTAAVMRDALKAEGFYGGKGEPSE